MYVCGNWCVCVGVGGVTAVPRINTLCNLFVNEVSKFNYEGASPPFPWNVNIL